MKFTLKKEYKGKYLNDECNFYFIPSENKLIFFFKDQPENYFIIDISSGGLEVFER